MAKFSELSTNINQVMLQLIQSQNLCKYLYYQTVEDTPTDPLEEIDLTLTERKSLMYSRIFPYPKIPLETDAGSYLTVIFNNIKKGDSIYFKNMEIVFAVICHQNQWRLLGKVRPYEIHHEVDVLLNNQSVIGIGNVQFERSRFVYFNKSFSGYEFTYKVCEES